MRLSPLPLPPFAPPLTGRPLVRRPQKGSIFFWSAVFTVGVAIQTGSINSLAQITVGRFIAGLGVGAMSAIVSLQRTCRPPPHCA